MNECLRRRHVAQKIILFNLLANLAGYFLVTGYMHVQQMQKPFDWRHDAPILLILAAIFAFLFYFLAPLRRWYLRHCQTGETPGKIIRTQAVNVPLINAIIAFIAWSLHGGAASFPILASSNPQAYDEVGPILFISFMSAGIAASIAFASTEYLWQHELGIFFPHGHVRESVHFPVFSLRSKIYFFLGMGNLALIVMAWQTRQILLQTAQATHDTQLIEHSLQRISGLETLIIIAAILTSILVALTFGNSLVGSVHHLTDKMQAVQKGNLDVQARIYLPQEFSTLADGFNDMLAALRQEETLRDLLNKYVTPEIAHHVIEHGAELGGQQVEGTVLFADLRNFTRLSTQVTPQKLVELINLYFNALNKAVIAHHGIINKFGGDSLLALWIPPFTEGNTAQYAIQSAQDMLYRLDALKPSLRHQGLPELKIGIGIAHGPIVIGHIGNAQRMEFTALGASVNLASRLQSLTKSLSTPLLFDANTAQAIAKTYATFLLGYKQIRGWHTPLPVYTLSEYKSVSLLDKTRQLWEQINQR